MIETMGGNGHVSVVGRLAGAVPQFNTASLFFRRLKIGGVAVGTYTRPQAHAAWLSLQNCWSDGGDAGGGSGFSVWRAAGSVPRVEGGTDGEGFVGDFGGVNVVDGF